MKIGCSCGACIVDQTDYLPHKGYLIPDQEWFAILDAIDADIIDALASGRLPRSDAYRLAREIIRRASRLIYQCGVCGRLFIDDAERHLQSDVPATEETSREILRSRPNETERSIPVDPPAVGR
jgi:hypothetical protein